jgi:hypothetical protein
VIINFRCSQDKMQGNKLIFYNRNQHYQIRAHQREAKSLKLMYAPHSSPNLRTVWAIRCLSLRLHQVSSMSKMETVLLNGHLLNTSIAIVFHHKKLTTIKTHSISAISLKWTLTNCSNSKMSLRSTSFRSPQRPMSQPSLFPRHQQMAVDKF